MFPPEGASGAGAGDPAAGSGSPQPAVQSGGGTGAATAGAESGGTGGGSPQRDWQKDYGDLETRHKSYERYGTPEQIDNAIRWAQWGQGIKQRLDAGEYVPRSEIQKLQAGPQAAQQPQGDPFDRWDELTPRDQARYLRDQVAADIRSGVIDPLRQELQTTSTGITGQHQLLLQLVQQIVKNPGLDPKEILSKATEMMTLPPEQMLQRVVEMVTEPGHRQKAIDDAVKAAEQRIEAKYKQDRENDAIKQFGGRTSGGLRLAPTKGVTRREQREAAMREVAKVVSGIS